MAATDGFITALLSNFCSSKGACIWIGPKRNVFPPGLKFYGISPEKVLFITPDKEKHLLWAVEEALKCNALTAVVAEVNQMDFTASRRLQLVIEQSNVTGFVIRNNIKILNANACVARWRITSLPSEPINDLPGIGYPRWNVELLRVRNGKPGKWEVQWREGKFHHPSEHIFSQEYNGLQTPGHLTITERKAG
jgi:protein ImuA